MDDDRPREAAAGVLSCPAAWLDRCLVVRPVGVLDLTTYSLLHDTLVRCAVDGPDAVVVDLGDVSITADSALSAFTTAWLRTCDWPAVPIIVVASPTQVELLHRVVVHRYVTVHASVASALANVDQPPPRKRSSVMLPHDLISPSSARRFVRNVCEQWQLPVGLTGDAVQVASELVQNTVQHTESDARMRLELGRDYLTVAVSDRSPAHAVITDVAGDHRNEARGLRLVAQLAKSWGCLGASDGGKTVWAVLRH